MNNETDRELVLLRQIADLRSELALIHDAANDEALSDGAVRAIASGLSKVTAEDIAWATHVAEEKRYL